MQDTKMSDRRSAVEWYRDGLEPPHHKGRWRGPAVVVALALLAGGGYAGGRLIGLDPTSASRDVVYTLLDDIPSLPPLPSPQPSAPGEEPTPAPVPGKELDLNAFRKRYQTIVKRNSHVAEGEDFSFIDKVQGVPPRWSCVREVPVVLVGSAPPGTVEALHEVVRKLESQSGLALRVETAVAGRPRTGVITLYYAHADVQPGSFSVSDPAIGRGGPSYRLGGDRIGMIDYGEVVVRDDVPGYEPTTNAGKDVLAHELMHALGVGHSDDGRPEVMAPVVAEQWPGLGRGDQVALDVVGCE